MFWIPGYVLVAASLTNKQSTYSKHAVYVFMNQRHSIEVIEINI